LKMSEGMQNESLRALHSTDDPRKRLNFAWEGVKPKINQEDSLLETNFGPYSHAVAPDMLISNGNIQMAAHKEIIERARGGSRHGLDKKGLFMGDVEDATLQFLYSLIYDNPQGQFRSGAVNFIKQQFRSMNHFYKDAIDCIVIHKFEIMREFMIKMASQSSFEHGNAYEFYYDYAKKHGLKDLCHAMHQAQIDNRLDERIVLSTFKKDLIRDMIEANNWRYEMEFMDRMTVYMKAANARKIAKELNDIEINTGFDEKLELEMRKNRMLLACGYKEKYGNSDYIFEHIGSKTAAHMGKNKNDRKEYHPDGNLSFQL